MQRPGPPVLIGGMSRGAMERAGRIGDGWVTASNADLSVIAESAKVVQGAARAAGRGPARIVCRGVLRPGKPSVNKATGQRRLLSGSYEQIREESVAGERSLGCTGRPSRLVARMAITSFAFMLLEVPDPVWNTSMGTGRGTGRRRSRRRNREWRRPCPGAGRPGPC